VQTIALIGGLGQNLRQGLCVIVHDRHPDRLTNAKTPVLLEIRGAAGHEPSRERAHETDERHKRAEVIFHVFQLLIESSPLVLKEALTRVS
jgi:hypothetical protein